MNVRTLITGSIALGAAPALALALPHAASAEVDKTQITEAITRVIWTAQPASEIRANEIRQFTLSIGPVPDIGKIVLNALQTYSDSSVVKCTGNTLARVLGIIGLVVGAVGVGLSVVTRRRSVAV
ncbi:DUF1775 domain-containing protein [Frigoribacterium sp. CG_9.8]|uniref:DUF1775 domain-containing protein n=1 Tax=Frigoribacterium sp. CG_9.8 TaxID=2787733 RepID=UPI0018CA5FE8|nr:DUF1775 domain-containing protein [Frigoribacterium sp. CG_9.8]MBG6107232.1 hypothetical protein [Frigoribacterium sp. CG_9.8]